MSESRILLIDDHGERAMRVATLLEFMDFSPRTVSSPADIDTKLARQNDWVAIVVGETDNPAALDEFMHWLGEKPLHPPVLTLPNDAADTSWQKPLHPDSVWPLHYPIRRTELQDVLRRASLKRITEEERQESEPQRGLSGRSEAVCRLKRMIEQVAPFDTTVLILGESGTGKEVTARSVHDRSRRAKKPFVAINCGAIPPDLLESELFGHEKGAFTGALTQRKGRFEMAEGGTLLLDEIGDMSLPMQVKLLRVLQERVFDRVGGSQSIPCDVRVIAATHRNLEQSISDGKFREDLFYRLNVFPIEMPTLRERCEDLPDLIFNISRQLADSGRGRVTFSSTAITALQHYRWPGNVRELGNLIERMAVLHPGGTVQLDDLPARYRADAPEDLRETSTAIVEEEPMRPMRDALAPPPLGEKPVLPEAGIDLREHMADIELELIKAALQQTDGVITRAAPLLGLRRTTLVEKLRKYGIDRDGESVN